MAIITSGYTGSKARHNELVKKVGNQDELWDIFEDLPLFEEMGDIGASLASFFAPKPVLNPVAHTEAPVIFNDGLSLYTAEWEVY